MVYELTDKEVKFLETTKRKLIINFSVPKRQENIEKTLPLSQIGFSCHFETADIKVFLRLFENKWFYIQ